MPRESWPYGKMRDGFCPGGHMPGESWPYGKIRRPNLSWWADAKRSLPTGSKPDWRVRLCEVSNPYSVRGR